MILVDVARCNDGTISNYIVFEDTCRQQGGIAEWLASYGQCRDDTIIEMSSTASCRLNGGFLQLMASNFVPPTTAAASLPAATSVTTPAVPPASTTSSLEPTTTVLDVGTPRYPVVSLNALAFLDLDECHMYELNDAGQATWYECTRSDPTLGGTAVLYITEGSDQVAAYNWAMTVPGFNENAAVLYWIEGGGIVYEHDGYWEMFDVGLWPDDLHVVDTDCAPFPEPNPELCPATALNTPAPGQGIMPDVVCLDLQHAQDTIQTAGVFFSRSEDATGQGRMQIIDRNWIVVAQTPPPGTPIGEFEAVLSVVKDEEPNDC